MESGFQGLVQLASLVAALLSLAIPLYCIPTALIALFRRASYYPSWPLWLAAFIWLVQWPLVFVVSLVAPGAGSFAGDGHETLCFDLVMFFGFIAYDGALSYWVFHHIKRYVYRQAY